MKIILYFTLSFIGSISLYAQASCEKAFSAANYSVAHTTNAYNSNNNDHVQEWSFKSIETFREVEEITQNCGCEDVANLAWEGYVAAEKAQEQNTWERSRFYAKRANQKAKLMMDALAECTNVDVSKIENADFDNDVYASSDENLNNYYSNEDLEDQKAELVAQQKILEERQAELAKELEKKKNEAKALKIARDNEILKQKAVKTNAELALSQINNGFQNLANALGCKQAYDLAKSSYEYTQKQINNSNLDETKLHYTLKLNEIAEKAMLNFSDCASGF